MHWNNGKGKGSLRPKHQMVTEEDKTMKKTMEIEGMMCAHCKAHVEQALNALPGVQGTVNLEAGTAVVTAQESVDDASLTKAVVDAGYTVKAIRT